MTTTTITLDGLRELARLRGCGGVYAQQWRGPDGKWTSEWTSREMPVEARVGVMRARGGAPVWGAALWVDFAEPTKLWDRHGLMLLTKRAEAEALRAFLGMASAKPVRACAFCHGHGAFNGPCPTCGKRNAKDAP